MTHRRVFALTLLPVALALLALSADPTAPADRTQRNDDQPRVVQARSVENPPPRAPGIEALREDAPRGMLPLPKSMTDPDFYEPILPRQLPARTKRPDGTGERTLLSYDAATGEVTRRTFAEVEDLLPHRYTEAGIGVHELLDDPEGVAKNFSTWLEITDPTVGTYPRHVKLFIDFIDQNGNPTGAVCSGTLIDPKHVITAAHCAWSHEIDGNPIGDFAVAIEVVPSYHDNIRPYGNAQMSQIHVWESWPDDHDYDHDIAIVDLDRPIGALVGWWGYGYNTNCDFWETFEWRHAGWPAESPYDGESLWRNLGDFDDCSEEFYYYVATFDSPSWGGSSGSGALKLDTSAIYAVLSTSDRETATHDCQLTENKFNHIGQIIAEDKPSSIDLVAMDVNAPAEIESGYWLGEFNFKVMNYSTATMYNSWPYEMYLSTDDVITTGDVYLGGGSFDWTFYDNTAVRVNVTAPTIPATTPTGDYFLGVILTHSDVNLGNNASHGQEASPIHVTCPPSDPPEQLGPWNGQTCLDFDVYFTWQPVAPLAEYKLELTTGGNSTEIITQQTSYMWENLQPGTSYWWRMASKSQCGSWGPWHSSWSFTTKSNTAQVASAVSPADGEHCVSSSPTLEWSPLPDILSYDLQYSDVWCYEGTIVTGLTSPQYTLAGLDPGVDYYWRVRGHTECGQTTDWSSVPGFCFTFKTAPVGGIDPPTRIAPADGTSCGSASTHLLWGHADDWDHYEVQVGTSCATGPIYTTTSNGYSPPGLISGEVYYWRVRTFHECGQVSDWTDCWSFSLDLEPPTNPSTLASSSHTVGQWSNDGTIDVWWDLGSDNCDGSWPQYATLWDTSPTTEPTEPTTSGEMTNETSPPLPDGQNHWFHLRTVDWAGNPAVDTMHLGPFWIDTTPPRAPELDYLTIDPGLITGPTTLIVDWLPCTDDLSGMTGYSWSAGTSSTPPPGHDNVPDTQDLWAVAPMTQTGGFWFFVRACDLAGNGSPDLALGPYTVDLARDGVFVTHPERGDVLTEGDVYRIVWDIYHAPSVSIDNAQLEYSLDAGDTWHPIVSFADRGFALGYYDWTVPMAASEEAVVRLTATDLIGRMVYDRSVRFTLVQVTGTPPSLTTERFSLAAARPNPFNPQTTIAYAVPHDAQVRLRIYDVAGRLVRTLVDGFREGPASYEAVWDGRDDAGLTVSSGVYRYALESGGIQQSRSMVLVK